MNGSVKRLVLSLLHIGGIFRLGRWLSRDRLIVLTYHKVLPGIVSDYARRPLNSVFAWEFEQQISYLKQHYHVVTGKEVQDFLTGQVSLPPHSVFITFDDGYENNYTEAFPILTQYGVSAAFFLTTDFIGHKDSLLWFDRLDAVLAYADPMTLLHWLGTEKPSHNIQSEVQLRRWIKSRSKVERDAMIAELESVFGHDENMIHQAPVSPMMTWSQAREMADKGMTIGSHTASHQILSSSPVAEVQMELEESRRRIEMEIGRPCWSFAYPNGSAADFRDLDKIMIRSAGYACAFTQIPGFVDETGDHYALPRISVPDFCDFKVFLSYLSGIRHGLPGVLSPNS